jgi:autotransporter-associated beta strand protein
LNAAIQPLARLPRHRLHPLRVASSALSLSSSITYSLAASGTFEIGGWGADAEYIFRGDDTNDYFTSGGVDAGDYGIAIDDPVVGGLKLPFWGPYNPAHEYVIDWQGADAPISLSYHDDQFGDNVGPLTVKIFQARAPLYWDTDGTGTIGAGGGAAPAGNWNGITPNFNSDPAGGAGTITALTTGDDNIAFAAGAGATGSYTVTISGTQSAAQVIVEEGNVTLAGGTIDVGTFNIGSGSSGTVSSVMTGGPNGPVVKKGSGTLTLTAANSYTGGTLISGGTLRLVGAGAVGSGNVTNHGTLRVLNNNALVNVDGSGATEIGDGTPGVTVTANRVRQATLNIGAGSSLRINAGSDLAGLSKVNTLTLGANGRLDLADNKLIEQNTGVGEWNGSNYDKPTGLIAAGRNGGGWGGFGIVTSQTDATTGNFTSIAIAAATEVKGIATNEVSFWSGQTVTGSDTLVMYTYGGDANLDGKINVDDYGKIDSSIPLGLSGWYNGDFNYDGKINVDDYGIIDSNVVIQGAPFATAGSAPGISSAVAVPEPACLVPPLLFAGFLRRQRRKMK